MCARKVWSPVHVEPGPDRGARRPDGKARRPMNRSGGIEFPMRFLAAGIAVIFLVQVSPRHGVTAAPDNDSVGDGLPPSRNASAKASADRRGLGGGGQTVPPGQGTWSEK